MVVFSWEVFTFPCYLIFTQTVLPTSYRRLALNTRNEITSKWLAKIKWKLPDHAGAFLQDFFTEVLSFLRNRNCEKLSALMGLPGWLMWCSSSTRLSILPCPGGMFWSSDYQIYHVLGLDEMNDTWVNQVLVGCGGEQLSLKRHFSMCL